jgi:sigma-B regulation protein RsbU (phosphoserine phosphatase)
MAGIRTRRRLLLGGLFFALMLVYAGGNAYQTFATRRSSTGWVAASAGARVVVSEVNPRGPAAAALRPGDVVLTVEGRAAESPAQVYALLAREPGHEYEVSIARSGAPLDLALRTTPVPGFTSTYYTLLVVVIPVIFIITGLGVFALRPDDKQAVLLALMFGMFIPSDPGTFEGLPGLLVALMVAGGIVSCFFASVFFHFFLVFPERSPLLKRFPRLEWLLYAPQLLLFVPFVAYTSVMQAVDPEGLRRAQGWLGPLGAAVNALLVAYVVAGVASLLLNYRQSSRQSRRKMRVVVAGCVVGFLPSLVMMAIYFYGPTRLDETLFRWVSAGSIIAFLVFPGAFAYAIVRHRVIPVHLIIRRGVRYVFVSQGSVVLEAVTVGVALTLFLNYIFTYLRPSSGLVIGVASGVFAVVIWNLTRAVHHRIIAPAIDRRFFRRAYNAQQILADLGQSLRLVTDVRELTQRVAARVQDALQPENVSVFLRDDETGDYTCAISSHHIDAGRITLHGGADLVLPRGAFTVRRLSETPQPLVVDFRDPQSWASILLSSELELSVSRRRESETLREVNSSLLVPVATKSELLGVLSLGPRLGDLPYSREDRQVLMAVALQTAFAIDNARLLKRKVEEERLRREIDMATEVQRRLFPESPPRLATLELAGVCHPARGVGGDYYDFILLEGGRVGVAVADVAGKGIAAALLMSTVQASLRSRADGVDDRLTDLVSTMNRLLNRSTGPAAYASFFYALFDERTRALTYVNAGHNPPLLVRAARGAQGEAGEARRAAVGGADGLGVALSGEVELGASYLSRGGPVIGLFESFVYEQETIPLETGDLVVAYTDGVTEALNPRGEEFGETRLEGVVRSLADLPAQELMEQVIEHLRDWCRDAPQHDDVTLVVLKVT